MHNHLSKISVHRGSDVGLLGHGIFSKTNVAYEPSKTGDSKCNTKKNKKKRRGSSAKLVDSGPRHNIKRRRKRKSAHSRTSRSKDTLF